MTTVLRVEHVSRSFRRRRVLRDVSLEVEAGELVGIVGENGSGKTTLLRIMSGDLRASSGSVAISGRLGYCPQEAVLNEALSIDQHIDYFGAAYRLPDRRLADELVRQLGCEQFHSTVVGKLSGGTKQKVNLLIALMHSPEVLLLDEPYQGFDWETYLRFWSLASDLRQGGCAVVIVSHLIFEQTRFDRIVEIRDGRLWEAAAHGSDAPSGGPVMP